MWYLYSFCRSWSNFQARSGGGDHSPSMFSRQKTSRFRGYTMVYAIFVTNDPFGTFFDELWTSRWRLKTSWSFFPSLKTATVFHLVIPCHERPQSSQWCFYQFNLARLPSKRREQAHLSNWKGCNLMLSAMAGMSIGIYFRCPVKWDLKHDPLSAVDMPEYCPKANKLPFLDYHIIYYLSIIPYMTIYYHIFLTYFGLAECFCHGNSGIL